MTKLIVVILIPKNPGTHNTTEAAKEVHEVHVIVEPERSYEIPEPLAVPKPHEVTEV